MSEDRRPMLVCEGTCNRTLEWWDARVREWRRDNGHEALPLSPRTRVRAPDGKRDVSLAGALRGLRYTPHVRRGEYYECAVCGLTRKWG